MLRSIPVEHAAIGRVVELREAGLSYREVADRLSAEGVRTKAGLASWSAKSAWPAVAEPLPDVTWGTWGAREPRGWTNATEQARPESLACPSGG